MTKPPADILRNLAALVLRHRLNGRTFPHVVRRWQFSGPGPIPPAVDDVVSLVNAAGRNLTPDGVACVLRGAAERAEVPALSRLPGSRAPRCIRPPSPDRHPSHIRGPF